MFVTNEHRIDNDARYSITADTNLKKQTITRVCTNESCHIASMTPDVYVIHRGVSTRESDAASWQDALADVTVVNAFVLLKKRCWRLFAPSLSFSAVILGSGSYK